MIIRYKIEYTYRRLSTEWMRNSDTNTESCLLREYLRVTYKGAWPFARKLTIKRKLRQY